MQHKLLACASNFQPWTEFIQKNCFGAAWCWLFERSATQEIIAEKHLEAQSQYTHRNFAPKAWLDQHNLQEVAQDVGFHELEEKIGTGFRGMILMKYSHQSTEVTHTVGVKRDADKVLAFDLSTARPWHEPLNWGWFEMEGQTVAEILQPRAQVADHPVHEWNFRVVSYLLV